MKKVLLFLLLLGLGLTLLWLAIGGEDPVATKPAAPGDPRAVGAPAGVPLQQGKVGANVSQRGPIEFPQYRTVQLPDGSARHERVFVLKAKDSQPVSETLQQLDDVEVLFFEDEKPASRVVARQALVELSRDASGRASLREQKDIDLRDAVFESLPGGRMQGVRLEIGDAKVHVGEAEIDLRTVSDTQPVLLVVDGERSGTLRGKGLQARLPRDRSSELRRADIEILHEPVLETAGITVRAAGRMHYSEDLATGACTVTLDDTVQLDLDRGGLAIAQPGGVSPGGVAPGGVAPGGRGSARITGDQFVGWLQRSRRSLPGGREREEVAWQRLLLTGSPTTVVLPEGRVTTPRISVLPGPFGDACLVTAHGGESRIEQTALRPGSKQTEMVTGVSPRRIHLVRPGASAGALHRSFGFPQWTVSTLDELQIAVFEGPSRLESESRTVEASKGLHLFAREGHQAGVARGFGDVRIEQRASGAMTEAFTAAGNDGFRLVAAETGYDLQLGPDAPADFGAGPWRDHRYEVSYGKASLRGTGACRVDRAGERTHLLLRAPGSQIAGRLASTALEFENVRQLDATIEGTEVLALDAAGVPARAMRTWLHETVRAAAPRLTQIGPRSLMLTGVPAGLPTGAPTGLWADLAAADQLPALTRTMRADNRRRRGGEVTVRGPRIDVHHLGGGDLLIDAIETDGQRPHANATIENESGGPSTATFNAARMRALPWALTPEMRHAHTRRVPGPLSDVMFATGSLPWLLVDDVRDFKLIDPKHGTVEGHGSRLVLSQGAQAGLFVGNPDTLEPAEVRRSFEGRELTVRGARVRVFREEDVRLQALRTFEDRPTFLLPSMTLHETGSDGLLAHMRASCQGNIDVLTDSVVFDGPVTAQGLRPDGSDDPEGIHIDANALRLFRLADSGELVRAVGQDVKLDWARADAVSREVEFDTRRKSLIARDVDGATVSLPGGLVYTARRVELNYETMAVKCYQGRLVQTVQ